MNCLNFDTSMPISLKADKCVYALPGEGRAVSVLRLRDERALDAALEKRQGMNRALGGCPWLNLPEFGEVVRGEEGVMLVETMPLASYDGPQDRWAKDLVSALGALHGAGWVHMDLKPEHLMWTDGRWRLHDFDSAMPVGTRFTTRDITYEYAPPDVRWYERADTRDDLYAATLMLYRRFNGGRLPFEKHSERRATFLRFVCPWMPVPRIWGRDAGRFFRRALARRRGRRYASLSEWAGAWSNLDMMKKAGVSHGEHNSEQESNAT